jgi:Transposase
MDSIKYIGMDVHKESISIAVMNGTGKLVMESIIETKAITVVQFIQGLRGDLYVTLEEGTWAAWLYDLLQPHVTKVVVCNPRKNALLKEGSKSDKIDARKLADLLRGGYVRPVYHGENGIRTLKELSRSYLTISKDLSRVVKHLFQRDPKDQREAEGHLQRGRILLLLAGDDRLPCRPTRQVLPGGDFRPYNFCFGGFSRAPSSVRCARMTFSTCASNL